MEVGMSFNRLIPLLLSRRTQEDAPPTLLRLPSSPTGTRNHHQQQKQRRREQLMVVGAKGKRGSVDRQFQRPPSPPLPKIEDDGNPKFVIFIRTANVYLWYPLSLITGGTTAKIMIAAKDNFLGKYIYKDTIARNLAAVIYKDEKGIQKTAFKQYRVLRSATAFRYGFKLVENNNVRAALSPSGVIDLPKQEELKTVLDKALDFFGEAASGAKESFGKLTSLTSAANEDSESESNSETKS